MLVTMHVNGDDVKQQIQINALGTPLTEDQKHIKIGDLRMPGWRIMIVLSDSMWQPDTCDQKQDGLRTAQPNRQVAETSQRS